MLTVNEFMDRLAVLMDGSGSASVNLAIDEGSPDATVIVRIDAKVSFFPSQVQPVSIVDIEFMEGEGAEMATAKVVLSPAAKNVTRRPVQVTVGGGTAQTFDYMDPNTTFTVNDGDEVVATAMGDVDTTGASSPPSDPFRKTFSAGGGGGGGGGGGDVSPPVKPTISDIVFTP